VELIVMILLPKIIMPTTVHYNQFIIAYFPFLRTLLYALGRVVSAKC